jgi:hypothetical protein
MYAEVNRTMHKYIDHLFKVAVSDEHFNICAKSETTN